MPQLAIVIVSYNTCDLLRRCLQSIFVSLAQSQAQLSADVIVVDNASRDRSAEMVRNEFPQVYLIASQENLGFTRANNLALQALGMGQKDDNTSLAVPILPSALRSPHFIILLNPDTQVMGDALWQMVACLQAKPEAGACGAHLRYGDGSFQHGAFHFPSLAQVAIDLFPVSALPGGHRLYDSGINGRYPAALWQGNSPFPVDFVLGAALMVKTEVIRQVGLLDEGYFMYCEEMDWCLRIWNAGWQILALPNAQIIHYEGQSSKQMRWVSFVRLWRSRLRFYSQHHERYSALQRWGVRTLLAINLVWRKRTLLRHFARGIVSGSAVAEELAAYDEVLALVRG
ncbi:MAG: glycosyltransferase family 2 protein [Caldilineaceae bacterium]